MGASGGLSERRELVLIEVAALVGVAHVASELCGICSEVPVLGFSWGAVGASWTETLPSLS